MKEIPKRETNSSYTTYEEFMARRPLVQAAMDRANRNALLEHARMGRPVCVGKDGKSVWLQPVEIFALYGLDEFGREIPQAPPIEPPPAEPTT